MRQLGVARDLSKGRLDQSKSFGLTIDLCIYPQGYDKLGIRVAKIHVSDYWQIGLFELS